MSKKRDLYKLKYSSVEVDTSIYISNKHLLNCKLDEKRGENKINVLCPCEVHSPLAFLSEIKGSC
jgi:hypothetical protein